MTVPAAAQIATTTGYTYTRAKDGTAQPYRWLWFKLMAAPGQTDSIDDAPFTATSSDQALLTVTLIQGATYCAGPKRGARVTFTVPTGVDSFALPSMLGAGQNG